MVQWPYLYAWLAAQFETLGVDREGGRNPGLHMTPLFERDWQFLTFILDVPPRATADETLSTGDNRDSDIHPQCLKRPRRLSLPLSAVSEPPSERSDVSIGDAERVGGTLALSKSMTNVGLTEPTLVTQRTLA
ncbi:hypothetical protein H6P81_003145 [Aristolochia fimbriata]|uniref:Uncharacterized protein n=1 Tax=Aristolochia fimbriata TaxID=158543 RepID=A0AAV7FF09_ARIFI|nr:hypothetical protein H6P81_003145 [Aristolochia fimbriata]